MMPHPQYRQDSRHWRCPALSTRLLLTAFLLLAPRAPMAGQQLTNIDMQAASREFAIQSWRTDNGIPQNTITAVFQTRRGYIWAGTYNGLVQFDGLRFKVFDSSNTPGLPNSRVTSLYEDATGTSWIGHDSGEVTRHDGNGFSTIRFPPTWPRNPVKGFVTDEAGDVWTLNQLGQALRIRDGRIVDPPPLMGDYPFINPCVTVDSHNQAYVVRNGVAARFTSTGYSMVNFSDPSSRPYYGGMAASRDGTIWVAGEGRLRKWDGAHWVADVAEFSWPNVSVTVMMETSSGRLFVGTLQHGLLVYDPSIGWFGLNRGNGLPQDWVCSIAEDSERNIWVGTGGGLALLRQRKLSMLNPPDDWQGRPVLSITRGGSGAVWAATEGSGVYRYNEGNWTHFMIGNPFVWSVFEDSQREVWAGTWGGGLFRLEDDTFVSQTNIIGSADPVTALLESPPGTLWLGTSMGLAQVRDGKAERMARFGGAAAGDVRCLAAGLKGEIWIGTQGSGLGSWNEDRLRTFQTNDGLAGNYILSLCVETNGTLWVGMLDKGLCRYKDGRFKSITATEGLPSSTIDHIEDDQLGNLWFNSTIGIFRISKNQLNACADGTATNLAVLAYGKTEGMSTIAGTGGFAPSGFRAPDGRLWLPTAHGIAVVMPKTARLNPVTAPVWVEDVTVDGQSVPLQANPKYSAQGGKPVNAAEHLVVLQPGRRQLEVQFTGLSFTSPERVMFKYRLEGLDNEWPPPSTRRRVTYSFLPPGEYAFHVIACNSDGLWSENGDTLAIVVLPHFWQTIWFKILMIVAGATLPALIFLFESRRRLHHKLELIARERALEQERSRIAQDIHDDLGASLTRIGLLSESAVGDLHESRPASDRLEQIISTTRELTRSMDEIVWAVNPRHDTLESLTNYIARFAHNFLSAASIRCRLALPVQLPDTPVRSEVRHNLFLACKEALHNVVKHSKANEVRLKLEFEPGGLRFVIADNGAGFDAKSRQDPSDGKWKSSGNGLTNLESRLKQIGGSSRIESIPGEGTRVEFFVPLDQSAPS